MWAAQAHMWFSVASLTALYAQSAYATFTAAPRRMGWSWGQPCLQYEGQRNWGTIPYTYCMDGDDLIPQVYLAAQPMGPTFFQ